MKIFIDDKKLSGGPLVFRDRLIKQFKKRDYIIVHDPDESCDVELGFIVLRSKKAKKKILRLDGVYYQQNQISMNEEIRRSIEKSDAVICQSEFSKNMIEKMVCKLPNQNTVIMNGIDYELIKSSPVGKKYASRQFVMCADWRNTKRPLSAIHGFNKYIKSYGDTDSKLLVIGDFTDYLEKVNKKILVNCIFVNRVENGKIYQHYKSSDYMIHLCYIDSCPNAVVEGVACGLPTLCTNLGGTSEIVGKYGIVMHCDSFNYTSIPKVSDALDPDMVALGIKKLTKLDRNPEYINRLDINITVDKYINFIETIL